MISWALAEMKGAAVWDRRCVRSLVAICELRVASPLESFSQACGNAVRQAATRILSHATSTVDGLLRGHYSETHARCREFLAAQPDEPLLVVQDTTAFDYTSHLATPGLGPINTGGHTRGLHAHAALALPVEGPPLGFTHLALWARDPSTHGKRRNPAAQTALPIELKESQKWIDGLWGTEATLPGVPLLLIGDREADIFELFAAERRPTTDILIRSRWARNVHLANPETAQPSQKLPEVLAASPCLGTVLIEIPRGHGHPARQASLELRAAEVWLVPPDSPHVRRHSPLRVWAVEARETRSDQGETILWVLLSTRPVRSLEDAARAVRHYTRRWVIEEIHLVLKSGLRVERLQIDDADSLKNALALHYVAAWRIVQLRDWARKSPDEPAELVVRADEKEVLEAVEKRPLLTVRDVVRAIAHLGGFPRYPSAGEPGVRTLWMGLNRLDAMVEAWHLAKGHT